MAALGLTEPLDFESDVPIYEQIAHRVKFAIARGAYGPDDPLPSVRALAKTLLVNPNTIVRVYRELELQGLLRTQPGKGVFAAQGAQKQCRRDRTKVVEEKLREVLGLARTAELGESELEELWNKLKGSRGRERS
jgi:GntR family transcriptional regulator